MMRPVDFRTSLGPQAGLTFDRSMADLLCHRSFFSSQARTGTGEYSCSLFS